MIAQETFCLVQIARQYVDTISNESITLCNSNDESITLNILGGKYTKLSTEFGLRFHFRTTLSPSILARRLEFGIKNIGFMPTLDWHGVDLTSEDLMGL